MIRKLANASRLKQVE
jgi:DNA-nicking Smr family endonuclease